MARSFCFIGNSAEFPMKQNAPQGCASTFSLRSVQNRSPLDFVHPRGDEVYASHTARARRMRKAHSFLLCRKPGIRDFCIYAFKNI